MSSTITIKLDSNADQIASALDQFPAKMGKQIARAMDEVNERTTGIIQRDHLRQKGGAHSLGVVSGRLVQSAAPTPSVVIGNVVRSAIGSNAVGKDGGSYPRAWEFGFQGAVQVRAFTRAAPSRDTFARGKRGGKKGKQSSGIAHVRAFTRQVNMPEKAMFRTGIQENRQDYVDTISLQVVDAWGGQTGQS